MFGTNVTGKETSKRKIEHGIYALLYTVIPPLSSLTTSFHYKVKSLMLQTSINRRQGRLMERGRVACVAESRTRASVSCHKPQVLSAITTTGAEPSQ